MNPNQLVREVAQGLEIAEKGDYILLVRGFHSDPQMNTPTITTILI